MSVVNQALAQSVKHSKLGLDNIERIKVEQRKARPAWLWVLAGFSVSLALGGWSVSWQSPDLMATSLDLPVPQARPSPTQKTTQQVVALYNAPVPNSSLVNPPELLPPVESQPLPALDVVQTSPAKVKNSQPSVQLAANTAPPPPTVEASSVAVVTKPVMIVQQVALTAEQLAEQQVQRAQKALANQDFQAAVNAYAQALRYTPNDETTRQKLAALYYGKGDGRKAFDLLQAGIERNPDGEMLRLALAKWLSREKQEAAALVPLAYLPSQPSVEYLALRAGLAQKTKQNHMALQSYQQLTEQDPNNGRWWLGLAIQQERTQQWAAAQYAYQQALNKVGLSSQSHTFIHQRLQQLSRAEEMPSGH
ncbi:tetratricopeptide repeat protein [Vibrio sp. dsl-7]|uniref:Tetratricopeptide repeat protein n=1 Tax=Vibrio chanodichtyis TaxID=3027932 RepID=A0ABT5V2C6_9VIBR|nr:tetratricopeptide repeat protein [Vibrio chanodichtyis]MDE1515810.1 tetratricopeptide repeat protein [Vibrio chanodichtyis]